MGSILITNYKPDHTNNIMTINIRKLAMAQVKIDQINAKLVDKEADKDGENA